MHFAMTLLSRFGIAIATGHLVNTSIIVKTHTFPSVVSISGPTISIAIVWFGKVARTVFVMPALKGRGVFLFLHPEQLATHLFMSFVIPGQKKCIEIWLIILLWPW